MRVCRWGSVRDQKFDVRIWRDTFSPRDGSTFPLATRAYDDLKTSIINSVVAGDWTVGSRCARK